MYEIIQTNVTATFYSVCFEMFETDEKLKMDIRIKFGNLLDLSLDSYTYLCIYIYISETIPYYLGTKDNIVAY